MVWALFNSRSCWPIVKFAGLISKGNAYWWVWPQHLSGGHPNSTFTMGTPLSFPKLLCFLFVLLFSKLPFRCNCCSYGCHVAFVIYNTQRLWLVIWKVSPLLVNTEGHRVQGRKVLLGYLPLPWLFYLVLVLIILQQMKKLRCVRSTKPV